MVVSEVARSTRSTKMSEVARVTTTMSEVVTWMLMVCLTAKQAQAQDAAVIFGGKDSANVSVSDVEVYTGHNHPDDLACDYPSILEKPPGNSMNAAGVFVPGHGIYLCGGGQASFFGHPSCFYLRRDLIVNRQWTLQELPQEWKDLDGDPAFEATTVKNKNGNQDLMLYGPSINPGTSGYNPTSYILTLSEEAPVWKPGFLGHKKPEKDQKITLIKWNVNHLRHVNVDTYLEIIPGDPYYITLFYCTQDANICDDTEWDFVGDSYQQPGCSNGVYSSAAEVEYINADGSKENKIILRSQGTLEDENCNVIISIQSWTDKPTLSFTPSTGADSHVMSTAEVWISLNGVALQIGNTENCRQVHRYSSSFDTWEELPPLHHERCTGHTAVSVPIHWICGIATTTEEPETTAAPATTAVGFGDCPAGWIDISDLGCYKFLEAKINHTWVQAQYDCESIGGYLAEPSNQRTSDFLHSLADWDEDFSGIRYWYIGLTDLGNEGGWNWIHSTGDLSFSKWGNNRPISKTGNTADCGVMVLKADEYWWEDWSCLETEIHHSPVAPVCQRDTDAYITTSQPETTPGLKCESGWSEFEGACYKYTSSATTWVAAAGRCGIQGASLVSLHSKEQEDFLKSLASNDFWLGGVYTNGEAAWLDGSEFDYDYVHYTDYSCIYYDMDYYYMRTVYCESSSNTRHFVCVKI